MFAVPFMLAWNGTSFDANQREEKNGRIAVWEREGRSDLTSSCPVALFIFLSAAAGAGIVSADLVVGSVDRSLRCHWFFATVQRELGLWT